MLSDKEHEGIKDFEVIYCTKSSNGKESSKELQNKNCGMALSDRFNDSNLKGQAEISVISDAVASSKSTDNTSNIAAQSKATDDYDSADYDFISEYFKPKVAFTEADRSKHRKHLRAWQEKKKNEKKGMWNKKTDGSYDSDDMWELDNLEKDMLESRKKRPQMEFLKKESDDLLRAWQKKKKDEAKNKKKNVKNDESDESYDSDDMWELDNLEKDTLSRKKKRAVKEIKKHKSDDAFADRNLSGKEQRAKKKFKQEADDDFADQNLDRKTIKYYAYLRKCKQEISENMKKIRRFKDKKFKKEESDSDDSN
jgi:hypothetical protein